MSLPLRRERGPAVLHGSDELRQAHFQFLHFLTCSPHILCSCLDALHTALRPRLQQRHLRIGYVRRHKGRSLRLLNGPQPSYHTFIRSNWDLVWSQLDPFACAEELVLGLVSETTASSQTARLL